MTHDTDHTPPDPRLAAALGEIVEEKRRDLAPPSTEEMLARIEGELEPGEEEAFDERLALHPEAARRFLELAEPPATAVGTNELPRPSSEVLSRRLAEEGLFDPPRRVAPFRATDLAERDRRRVHPGYRWAAAAFFLLSLGLGASLLHRSSPPVAAPPPANLALVELVPRADSGRRDAGEALVADASFAYALLLWADEAVPDVVYRLTAIDTQGREVLRRDLRTNQAGRVLLRLAAGDLAPGSYELRLVSADEEQPVATYDLRWSSP